MCGVATVIGMMTNQIHPSKINGSLVFVMLLQEQVQAKFL